MLSDYAPILVFLALCVAFGGGVQLLNSVVGPRKPSPEKELPYECGIMPVQSARRRFSVVPSDRLHDGRAVPGLSDPGEASGCADRFGGSDFPRG